MKFEGNKIEIDYSLKNYILKKGDPQGKDVNKPRNIE